MKLLRICPDCGDVIEYNSKNQVFKHEREEFCAYMENIAGERIWDDKMRDGRLAKITESAEDDDQMSFF